MRGWGVESKEKCRETLVGSLIYMLNLALNDAAMIWMTTESKKTEKNSSHDIMI